MIVLDTSALLFWTLDPPLLSPSAGEAIAQADQILVSSISIWEIGVKVKRDKLVLPIAVRDYAERLATVERVQLLPVDTTTWLDSLELSWEHKDPADRVIVATARRLGCSLLTSDRKIARFYAHTVW